MDDWTLGGGNFSLGSILGNDNDNDMDEMEEPEPVRPVKKKHRVYEPCGLDSRQKEENELGIPDRQGNCFGCVYIGEQDAAAIPYEDIIVLINYIRKSIARTDPINLSQHVAEQYAALRAEINSSLMPGEKPLPPWSAATILDHIRNHNTDPEIQTWVRLSEIQELMQVALYSSVEQDVETGTKQVNEKQCKIYMDLCKMAEQIQKSDPTKKNFYKPGAHIDMKSASQGFIAISGKNLTDMWNNTH